MTKNQFACLIIVVVIVLLGVILYPVLLSSNSGIPLWKRQANEYTAEIANALRSYATDHEGHLPSSLIELYPRYISDSRVGSNKAVFGGKQVTIKYYKPKKLGNSKTVILRINLQKTDRNSLNRPVVLYGDLHRSRLM